MYLLHLVEPIDIVGTYLVILVAILREDVHVCFSGGVFVVHSTYLYILCCHDTRCIHTCSYITVGPGLSGHQLFGYISIIQSQSCCIMSIFHSFRLKILHKTETEW